MIAFKRLASLASCLRHKTPFLDALLALCCGNGSMQVAMGNGMMTQMLPVQARRAQRSRSQRSRRRRSRSRSRAPGGGWTGNPQLAARLSQSNPPWASGDRRPCRPRVTCTAIPCFASETKGSKAGRLATA